MATILEQIDQLRGQWANQRTIRDNARLADGFWVAKNAEREMHDLEEKIDALLMKYIALPACPYPPCPGKLESTPTKLVLKCTHCMATTLPGKMEVHTL